MTTKDAFRDGLLITSCRDDVAKIVEARTGLEAACVPIHPGPDCVMFDPARGLALLPTGGDGVMTIVAIRGAKASDIGPATAVPAQVLARLGALDPKTGRLYLPTAQAKPVSDPGERRTLIPGTFAILVLAPN